MSETNDAPHEGVYVEILVRVGTSEPRSIGRIEVHIPADFAQGLREVAEIADEISISEG